MPNDYKLYAGLVQQLDLPFIWYESNLAQTIPDATNRGVTFSEAVARTGGFLPPTGGDRFFTPPIPGFYQVNYTITFDAQGGAAQGVREASVNVNGEVLTGFGSQTTAAATGGRPDALTGVVTLFFNGVGDFFEIRVFQTQGSPVDLLTFQSCSVQAAFIRP